QDGPGPEAGIQNPNASGQGTDPKHTEHPLYGTITQNGYEYRHTTPITGPDGKKYLHDTYKKGDRTVSVERGREHGTSYTARWATSARPGSGRQTRGRGGDLLDRHPKRAR